jgi:hypothetical protein
MAAAGAVVCLALAGCGGTSAAQPQPTAIVTATAATQTSTPRQRAVQAVAAEEQARKAAVAAVAATHHPDDDVWAAMNDPMVIPDEMATIDPADAAWTDYAAQADAMRAWWRQVGAHPTLPWSQSDGG